MCQVPLPRPVLWSKKKKLNVNYLNKNCKLKTREFFFENVTWFKITKWLLAVTVYKTACSLGVHKVNTVDNGKKKQLYKLTIW